MKRFRLLLMAYCALTLADCSTTAFPYNIPPGPEPYRTGYADGCDSGTREAGNPYYTYKRDWTAYQQDALYKQGWNEGHSSCFASYEAIVNH